MMDKDTKEALLSVDCAVEGGQERGRYDQYSWEDDG